MSRINLWFAGEETIATKSPVFYYAFAAIAGLGILVGLIIFLKGTIFLLKMLMLYWAWAIGALLVILVLRRIFKKKSQVRMEAA